MPNIGTLLFYDLNVRPLLRRREEQMIVEANALEEARLCDTSIEQLCDYFELRYTIALPRLKEGEITQETRETQVDISHEPGRDIRGGRSPYVMGTEVKFFVPFSGDGELFRWRPAFMDLAVHADIHQSELVLTYQRSDSDAEAFRKRLNEDLRRIRQNLERISKELVEYNASVRGKVQGLIEARRNRLTNAKSMKEQLGFPERPPVNVESNPTPEQESPIGAKKQTQVVPHVRVFISYSHDSADHMARVLKLSDRLRSEGIDCKIDRYEESPPEGWPKWMRNEISEANFVIVICTETYRRRFDGREEAGKGKGAKWEGAIITQEIYEAEGKNTKFVPVLFSAEDEGFIPDILRGATHYLVSSEDRYDKLYRRLTSQPEVMAPPIGEVRSMPRLPSVQDFMPLDEGRPDARRVDDELTKEERELLAAAANGGGWIYLRRTDALGSFVSAGSKSFLNPEIPSRTAIYLDAFDSLLHRRCIRHEREYAYKLTGLGFQLAQETSD